MVLAWGLELEVEEDTVKHVMNFLLDGGILLGMDSILEWVAPKRGTNISECYEDENVVIK